MLSTIEPTARRLGKRVSRSMLILEPTQRRLAVEPVMLAPGEHLLGSSSDCTTRLELHGVQPRHCEIVVRDGTTTVRALDRRTWLNNGPVTEARLKKGDRLAVGPVEFLVDEITHTEEPVLEALDPAPSRRPAAGIAPTEPTVPAPKPRAEAVTETPTSPVLPSSARQTFLHESIVTAESQLDNVDTLLRELIRDHEAESDIRHTLETPPAAPSVVAEASRPIVNAVPQAVASPPNAAPRSPVAPAAPQLAVPTFELPKLSTPRTVEAFAAPSHHTATSELFADELTLDEATVRVSPQEFLKRLTTGHAAASFVPAVPVATPVWSAGAPSAAPSDADALSANSSKASVETTFVLGDLDRKRMLLEDLLESVQTQSELVLRREQRIDTDRRELLERERRLAEDEDALAERAALVDRLEASGQDRVDSFSAAHNDLDATRTDLERRCAELEATQRQVAEQSATLEDGRLELAAQRAQVADQQRELAERQADLAEQESAWAAESERLQSRARRLDVALAECEEERGRVDADRQAAEAERRRAETLAAQAAKELAAANGAAQAAAGRELAITERESELSEREQSLSTREQAVSERETASSERDQSMSLLERALSEREQSLGERERQLALRAEEISARERESAEACERLESERARFDDDRRELEEARGRVAAAQSACDAERARIDAERAKQTTRGDELAAAQADLDVSRTVLQEKWGELDAERAALEAHRAVVEDRERDVSCAEGRLKLEREALRHHLEQAEGTTVMSPVELLASMRTEVAGAPQPSHGGLAHLGMVRGDLAAARQEAERSAAQEAAQAELEEREQACRVAESRLAEQRTELSRRGAELEKRAAELASATTALAGDREQVAERRRMLEEDRRRLDEEIARAEQERACLDGNRRVLDAQQAALTQSQLENNAWYEKLTAELSELDRRRAACDARGAELEGVASELRSRAVSLEARESDLSAHVDRLAQRERDVQLQERDLELHLLEKRRRVAEWEARADEVELRERTLNARVAEFDARARQIEDDEGRRLEERRSLDALQATVVAERREVETARAALETERNELTASRNAVERIRAELDADRVRLDAERRSADEAACTLEAERAVLAAERSALSESRTSLSAAQAVLESSRQALALDLNRLDADRTRLESLRSDLESGRLALDRDRQEFESRRAHEASATTCDASRESAPHVVSSTAPALDIAESIPLVTLPPEALSFRIGAAPSVSASPAEIAASGAPESASEPMPTSTLALPPMPTFVLAPFDPARDECAAPGLGVGTAVGSETDIAPVAGVGDAADTGEACEASDNFAIDAPAAPVESASIASMSADRTIALPSSESPFVTPGFGSPTFGSSRFDVPNGGAPGVDAFGENLPGLAAPSFEAPRFDQPPYGPVEGEASGTGAFGSDAPGTEAPGFQPPSFDVPSFGASPFATSPFGPSPFDAPVESPSSAAGDFGRPAAFDRMVDAESTHGAVDVDDVSHSRPSLVERGWDAVAPGRFAPRAEDDVPRSYGGSSRSGYGMSDETPRYGQSFSHDEAAAYDGAEERFEERGEHFGHTHEAASGRADERALEGHDARFGGDASDGGSEASIEDSRVLDLRSRLAAMFDLRPDTAGHDGAQDDSSSAYRGERDAEGSGAATGDGESGEDSGLFNDEAAAETPRDERSIDVTGLLRSLNGRPEEHAVIEPEPEPFRAEAAPVAPARPVKDVVISDIEDSDSVAAYMQQLFARNRRGASEPEPTLTPKSRKGAPAEEPARPKAEKIVVPAASPEELAAVAAEASESAGPRPVPEPLHKPDRDAIRASMNSLRAVANLNARTAVARHSGKVARSELQLKAILAGVSVVLAVIMMTPGLLGSLGLKLPGWALIGVSLIALVDFVRSMRQLRQAKQSAAREDASEKGAEPNRRVLAEEVESGLSTEDLQKPTDEDAASPVASAVSEAFVERNSTTDDAAADGN